MSTQLDPQYMIAPSLEEYFVDKSSGLPLSGGWVYFYSDVNRTTLKAIFKLSGSPGSYTYTQIANPMQLTSVGTASDGSGNDIKIYYKPYDSDGNVELYFIQVYANNAGVPGTFQWSRSAWPNLVSSSTEEEGLINYVPNGQFLLHNNIPAANTTVAGQITLGTTYVAQGGWIFQRPTLSTATDNITFTQLEPVTNPTGNPRYAIRIINSLPAAGDAYKRLTLRFPDVNSFTSDNQNYTFAFTGKANSGGSPTVSFDINKYFGAGGSADVFTHIANFTIGPSYAIAQSSFQFGTNVGKTIGANNDDYVDLILNLPVAGIFDISLTDFILTVGQITITLFPDTTNAEMITFSTIGYLPTPAYNGNDLYLPLKLTQQGIIADQSEVATIVGKVEMSTFTNSISTVSNELLCDGNTYQTNLVSPLGIPYSRLQAKIFNSTYSVPAFGTGPSFVTCNIAALNAGSLKELHLSTNSPGAVTNSADFNTGFTITTIHTGLTTGYISGMFATGSLYGRAITIGSNTAPSAGNSGFTVANLINTASTRSLLSVVVGSIPTASHYWEWTSTTGPVTYYMWFKVDGSGSDPAPGGTGTEVDLLSTYTVTEIAGVIGQALTGSQITKIVTIAASGITTGDYFLFSTLTNNYYVWYRKDGTGTDPAPANKIGIVVDILTADTDVLVCSKTVTAINSFSYATPQLQGVFLRGYDPNRLWDYDAGSRFGLANISAFFGNMLGTFELDQVGAHTHTTSAHSHTFNNNNGDVPIATGGSFGDQPFSAGGGPGQAAVVNPGPITSATQTDNTTVTVNSSTGDEGRPVNNYVVWVIKY